MDEKDIIDESERVMDFFAKQELTEEIAKRVGELARHGGYASGASISDLIVGCTAAQLGAKLATRNKKHFKGIPGMEFFKTT